DRIAFLLVDYKGGAAFKDCDELPHSVGMVTDLDEHQVQRALISLNAELKRREHVLHRFDAKDLRELERRDPVSAPPSLVIVIDEFATLAKEVPQFVDGVVDVAQRARWAEARGTRRGRGGHRPRAARGGNRPGDRRARDRAPAEPVAAGAAAGGRAGRRAVGRPAGCGGDRRRRRAPAPAPGAAD